MCMMMDANMWPDFLDLKMNMRPVHKWMEKRSGKLVYSDHEPLQRELTQEQRKALKKYYQSGQARFVPKEEVEREIAGLRENNSFKSNDIHILGLAKAAKAKVLSTKDKNLHYDFKHILNGNIYQDKSHEHLLTKDACP